MSPVLTRPPQAAPARLGREIATVVVVGLVAVAVILGVSAAVEGPSYLDRVTVSNETAYAVEVEVTGGDRDGWLDLGPVSPGDRHEFNTVIDKGDRWIVRVSSAGTDGGHLEMSRARLERAGWVVTIGDEVTARLAANGASPPAPRR